MAISNHKIYFSRSNMAVINRGWSNITPSNYVVCKACSALCRTRLSLTGLLVFLKQTRESCWDTLDQINQCKGFSSERELHRSSDSSDSSSGTLNYNFTFFKKFSNHLTFSWLNLKPISFMSPEVSLSNIFLSADREKGAKEINFHRAC